jgi:hypothetical protein
MFLLIPTPTLPSNPAARFHDHAISKAHFEYRWRNPYNLSLDPVITHLIQDAAKNSHLHSMKISKNVSLYSDRQSIASGEELAKAMEDKSDKSTMAGALIYESMQNQLNEYAEDILQNC